MILPRSVGISAMNRPLIVIRISYTKGLKTLNVRYIISTDKKALSSCWLWQGDLNDIHDKCVLQ